MRKQLTILLLFLCCKITNAQYATSFENITTAQGLPSDVVFACTEDIEGYVWIGTNKGLCRYNGKLWEQWNTDKGLPGNYITQVIPDKKMGLWINIAEKGIYFFNTKDFTCSAVPNTLNNTILLNETPNEIGVYIQRNTTISKTYYTAKNKKISEEKLLEANPNAIYIPTTNNKFLQLQTTALATQSLTIPKIIPATILQQPYTKTYNYIGNHNEVYFVNETEVKKISTEPLFATIKGKLSMVQTNEMCYIACANNEIVELDTFGNLTRYGKLQGMNNLAINHLYIAKDGSLYVSTLGGGINIMYASRRMSISTINGPIKDIHYGVKEYFAIDKINLIVCDQATKAVSKFDLAFAPTCLQVYNNSIAIGAMDGVYLFQYINSKLKQTKFLPTTVGVSSIAVKNNSFYCSTYGKGIGIIMQDEIIFYDKKYPFKYIEKLKALPNGFIAFSNENGFFTTNNQLQLQKHFTTTSGLLSNTVCNAYMQKDTLWVGGKKGIVKIVNDKVVKTFTEKDGFKGEKALNLGLQYNMIFTIVSEQRVQQLFNGKIIPLANNALQMQDGYTTTSSLIDEKISEVIVGDYKGLQILDIMEFQPNPVVTTPIILSIHINNKSVDTAKNIVLPYSFSTLAFKLSPLNDLIFNRNEILYKLNDEPWQKINDTLTINFTNLRPGEYNLYIKSINTYGIESPIKLLKTFTVKRPWWLQWWFLLLVLGLVSGTIYAIVKYKTKQKLNKQLQEIKVQQQLEAERQRISRDLHDNIGAYTSALIANVQKVKRVVPQEESINQMQQNAESILSSLRETIWVLNNREITIHELNDQFKNYMFKLLKNFEHISFNTNETITKEVVFTASKALHINKILQECIQNIIKHSKATTIAYTINTADKIIFSIQDNGCGFENTGKSYGNGLSNMEWRAKEAGIELTVYTAINKGTTIKLIV